MTSTIPQTAKAAVASAPKEAYVIKADHPVKQPQDLAPGECLVKLEYTGVCHTDAIMQQGYEGVADFPLVGGHEGIGRLVAIGENSPPSFIKVGDRVGVRAFGTVCMNCEMCRKGHEYSCSRAFETHHGMKLAGTFAEYVVTFTNYLTPIPEGLEGASTAPLLCAGVTAYKSVKQTGLDVGNWVAVAGAGGGLGHLAVQYAVAMGLRVIAIDTGENKQDLCLKLGAEKFVDFKTSDVVKEVQAITDGLGSHGAVITADHPEAYAQALGYLRFTGIMTCIGGVSLDATINLLTIIFKSLTVRGTVSGNRQDLLEVLDLAARGKVKARCEIRDIEDLNRTIEELLRGDVSARVVLKL